MSKNDTHNETVRTICVSYHGRRYATLYGEPFAQGTLTVQRYAWGRPKVGCKVLLVVLDRGSYSYRVGTPPYRALVDALITPTHGDLVAALYLRRRDAAVAVLSGGDVRTLRLACRCAYSSAHNLLYAKPSGHRTTDGDAAAQAWIDIARRDK